MAIFLSAFGDEIDPDLQTQLTLLKHLQVSYVEFRSAWGKNIKDLSDDELHTAYHLCVDHDMHVSCLGSPLGKTPILDPLDHERRVLERMFRAGEILGTRFIRIFSFYPPTDCAPHDCLDMSIERLRQLTEAAHQAGFTLLLENDEGLVGSSLENTCAILSSINSPALRHAWDGANFAASGEHQPVTDGWNMLHPYLGTVHVKDYRLSNHSRRAAGEGDAELGALFRKLKGIAYEGFLAIEPHPYMVDGRGELRGAEGMTYAVEACRILMRESELPENERI